MKNLYKSSHLAICFNSPHAFTKPSRHTHTDMYEICYCLKGDKKFVIGDQTYTLNNASLLLINKNTAHGFEHNRNSDACCLHFSREFLGGEIIEACSKFNILNIFSGEKIFYDFSRNIYLKIQIENKIKAILHEIKTDTVSLYKMRNYIIDILLLIHAFNNNQEKSGSKMSAIIKFISENHHDNINLNYISMKFGINYKTLSKNFISTTGMKFSHYLNQLRIEKSKKILESSGQSIISVCFESGYNDLAHFNKVFKKLTGISPGRYKKAVCPDKQMPDKCEFEQK